MYNSVICSPFVEHPFVDVAQFDAGVYDLTIFEEGQTSNFLDKGQFNKEQYCKCLVHKLFTLNKSKIKPFIQYQCAKMQEPIVWLNKLEKLIDLNRELFTTKEQLIKFEKSLMIIEVMRDTIEQKAQTPDAKFNFVKLKSYIKESSYEEKISCLMEAKTEYLQNKPKMVDVNEVQFDEKINLELELLKTQQKLSKKQQKANINSKIQSPLSTLKKSPTSKFRINTNLNQFVDIFFQLMHEKKVDSKPYLEASPNELADMITIWFKDKEGKEISIETVKTILKPSRFEKRPKGNAKINVI